MIEGYWGHAIGVITLILLVAFIGVWVWAWLPRHRRVFDRMARLPLENDEAPADGRPDEDGHESRTRGGDNR